MIVRKVFCGFMEERLFYDGELCPVCCIPMCFCRRLVLFRMCVIFILF